MDVQLQQRLRVVMYIRGKTLNLVVSSSFIAKQKTKCYIKPHLHTITDHEIILIQLKLGKPSQKKY